ncbi:uncharacterized protein LOC121631339 [Melanotaenia boesemani]|uniref:uncharacterized protein LOC121631339 n=1 Tax=Melanotaenia boesemani TaxID=1250792 RepID=UPI001C0516E2|nr:uncharacterized protein LOC121631339 [Melanotaenia boesemani]
MLEGQWSEALASNNIRLIIRWLEKLTTEGDADLVETLRTFSCWLQRTSEFAKKELLTLCYSRCQGLWMFLDRSSFARVHMLLQRLKNLLTLAQWARKQQCTAHLWHGVGIPCVLCRDTNSSSNVRQDCWNQEHRTLNQYIWLGRLVQWWGIMGLLPKFPEPQEVKRISQMWKEMGLSHRKACAETPEWENGEMGRFNFLIEGIVIQLGREHGCIWTSDDCTDQLYPPPNLQALLKLVLVPCTDNMSVQAILMYFILDVANFLQCKDNLLQSFCHAFTIPSSFSQQIRAFWLFDHGHVKASMELLLSPKATVPWLSWQHRCIIHSLMTRKQTHMALRYLHWTSPAIETVEDAKLYADVLLQNSCVSDAWALLKKSHTQSEDMAIYFLQACKGFNLCEEALKYIPRGYSGKGGSSKVPEMKNKDCFVEMPPCPLSAKLYRHQRESTVSSQQVVKLLKKSVMEVRQPHPRISEVVWPKPAENKSDRREIFLSVQALSCPTPSLSPVDMVDEKEETAHTDDQEEEQHVINYEQTKKQEHISSSGNLSSVSASSFTSASSFPLLKHPYVYKSTVTLQRISSLIIDGENQSGEEDEEAEETETFSPADSLPDHRELILTPDGTTDLVFLSTLDKECLVDLMLSAEGDESDAKADREEEIFIADALSGTLSSESLSKEDQSDQCISSKILSVRDAIISDDFLEIKVNQKGCEDHQQEPKESLSQDLSYMPFKTTQDVVTILGQSFEEISHSGSPRMVEQDSSILPTQLNIPGSSLNLSPAHNIKATSVPSYKTDEISPKSKLQTDELCNPSTSSRPDHCKAGNWWKHNTESRASSGLLSAAEPGVMISPNKKTSPCVRGQSYTYSLVSFLDFAAKQKDGKQAEKEEPEGWRGKAPQQGAIRNGRTRTLKGKRVKRR